MNTRTFALVWGIVFLLIAATGLIPGLLQPPPAGHELAVDSMHGLALGLFEVNILHTLVHLLFGVWGLMASRSWDAAKTFAKVTAVVYALQRLCFSHFLAGDMLAVRTSAEEALSVGVNWVFAPVADLDLAPGDDVVVVVKSTEVMIAKP